MNYLCHTEEKGFLNWVWQDSFNRKILLLSFVAIIFQFAIFKLLFPYPNFLPDSYSYLEKGVTNEAINFWPVGYSKFLRFISAFSHSDVLLTGLQYLLLEGSICYFLFSLLYWLKPAKTASLALFIFSIPNPVNLYISNFVSSDALFASISFIWISQLTWLLNRPSLRLIVVHSIVLLMIFSVRYNAIYYPIITLAGIALAHLPIKRKLLYAGISLSLITLYAFSISYEYAAINGKKQLSGFGGWQLASNALYMYSRMPDYGEQVPDKFKDLHSLVRHNADSIRKLQHRPDSTLGVYYLWDDKSPLKAYLGTTLQGNSTTEYFKKWSSVAPLYGSYGAWLIQKYPKEYLRYFLYPNLGNYCLPPSEFLGVYNMGLDTVNQVAEFWFDYKSRKIVHGTANQNILIMKLYPIGMASINLCFILILIGYLVLAGYKQAEKTLNRILILAVLFWCCNFCFSILASPIVLRYQIFPMFISFTIIIVLLEWISREARRLQKIEELIAMKKASEGLKEKREQYVIQ